MSDESGAALRITFRVRPSLRQHSGDIHERSFHGVPSSTAHKIADDFATYTNGEDHARQQELYRYRRITDDGKGKEVLLPLDFDEVEVLSVATDTRTREVSATDA